MSLFYSIRKNMNGLITLQHQHHYWTESLHQNTWQAASQPTHKMTVFGSGANSCTNHLWAKQTDHAIKWVKNRKLLPSSCLERTTGKIVSQYVTNLSEVSGILVAGCKKQTEVPRENSNFDSIYPFLLESHFWFIPCYISPTHHNHQWGDRECEK